ncbi:MAG: OsmC family protein [Deltaproteobacteria bacterium]|nr:OsmC family protein [Deltaproteobacteria bacterium]
MKEQQTYPEYIGVSDVTTRSFDLMRVEGYMDGQASILFDEPKGFDIGNPPELQGQSRGWTPVHAQLAALSACTSITIAVAARDLRFAYKGLRTKIRSLIDIRGFMADFDRQPEYCQVNYDLYLDTDQPKERIQALAEETDRRCPQLGLFRRARIPMIISWYREGASAPEFVQRVYIPEGGKTPEEMLVAATQATT